jgi:hypothetical protein
MTGKKLITRRSLLRTAGIAAPALLLNSAQAQFNGCPPGFCTHVNACTGTWTPLMLSSLKGWWDASVFASLTLSGTDVLAMADQSGLGQNLPWNAGSTTKPQYQATGFNSKPAIDFEGLVGRHLFTIPVFNYDAVATLTTWFVGWVGTNAHVSAALFSYCGAGGGGNDFDNLLSFRQGRDGVTSNIAVGRNFVGSTATSPTFLTPLRAIYTIDGSGNRIFYVNGVTTTLAGGPVSNFATTGELTIGDATQAGPVQWDGPVGELGIAASFTNSTDAALLDNYLACKWGF